MIVGLKTILDDGWSMNSCEYTRLRWFWEVSTPRPSPWMSPRARSRRTRLFQVPVWDPCFGRLITSAKSNRGPGPGFEKTASLLSGAFSDRVQIRDSGKVSVTPPLESYESQRIH